MFLQDINHKSYFFNTPAVGRTISELLAVSKFIYLFTNVFIN